MSDKVKAYLDTVEEERRAQDTDPARSVSPMAKALAGLGPGPQAAEQCLVDQSADCGRLPEVFSKETLDHIEEDTGDRRIK